MLTVFYFFIADSQSLLQPSSQPDIEIIDLEDDDLEFSQRPLFNKLMTQIKIKQEKPDEILDNSIPALVQEEEHDDNYEELVRSN